jgi:lysophospholipase L1-like esterase
MLLMNRMFRQLWILFLFAGGQGVSAGVEEPLKIGLIGDSTVADTYGWGPAFSARVSSRTQVLNRAKNGATLQSLSKALTVLLDEKPAYVLIQFGHNDQKRYGVGGYSAHLRDYVERVKKAGAKAVIVSSVTRRNFDSGGRIEPRRSGVKGTLPEYSQAARQVAFELKVPFIDLYALSVAHHNKIGPEASAVYDFDESDTTHFSKEGAAKIADLVVAELKKVLPELKEDLK